MQKGARYAEGSAHDLVARRVIDGNTEQKPGAACGRIDRLVDLPQKHFGYTTAPPDALEPPPSLPEFRPFQPQKSSQQPKNTLYLGRRAAPVVRRKCVHGQAPNAH